MCGRVFVKSSSTELLAAFAAVRREGKMADLAEGPRLNGAPSLSYPIIVADADAIRGRFTIAKWGLFPAWVKEPSPR